MIRAAGLVLAAAMSMTAATSGAETPRYSVLEFSELVGWDADDHAEALSVFRETCTDLKDEIWSSLCALAGHHEDPKLFFELFFRPVLIEDGDETLFTAYYEPEIDGSLTRGGPYQFAVYKRPPEMGGGLWYTREQIESSGILEFRGLEIAWLAAPVERFFLQVQGSGRIKLPDGRAVRVGYGGKNGHEYRSVGKELVRQGIYQPHQVSAQVIKRWVRANPDAGKRLLWHNPSYVFFREVNEVPPEKGPLGAMNRSITAMRSIAVDPEFTPLGAPVWVEKGGAGAFRRLMIAQDTGSAIKGAQRADVFYGTGDAAGKRAGRVRDGGRMVTLLPIELAFELAGQGS